MFLHRLQSLPRSCDRYWWQRLRNIAYVWYVFFISTRSIQNSKFTKNACGNSVYSGTDYTFPVLLYNTQYSVKAWTISIDNEHSWSTQRTTIQLKTVIMLDFRAILICTMFPLAPCCPSHTSYSFVIVTKQILIADRSVLCKQQFSDRCSVTILGYFSGKTSVYCNINIYFVVTTSVLRGSVST
jgi:hypothetical protein